MSCRVLILSYHFYPSAKIGARRASELACALQAAGAEVTVIAASGEAVAALAERVKHLRVIRVAPPRKIYPRLAQWWRGTTAARTATFREAPVPETIPNENPRRRLARWYHSMEGLIDDRKAWSALALLKALGLRSRWDWIISSGPPFSVHVAARLLKAATRARWGMDLRDPWLGNKIVQPELNSPLRHRIESWLERKCVAGADWIVAASPGIGRALAARYADHSARVRVVLNGYDDVRTFSPAMSGRLRLLYAGSLYLHRDPFPLLEAWARLARRPDVDRRRIALTFVGDCATWNGRSLVAWIAAHGLEDCVHVHPPVSPMEVENFTREAEVLVNFAQGQPAQIPGKLYEQLASGRELLLLAEAHSDAAQIVRASGAGRVVVPGDDAALDTAICELYRFYAQGAGLFEGNAESRQEYSRAQQNARFLRLLSIGGASTRTNGDVATAAAPEAG